jgi:hypothetical protein
MLTLKFNRNLPLWAIFGRSALAGAVALGLTFMAPIAALANADEVVLTVSGGPDATGQPVNATFSLAQLQALPKTSFSTTTMWTEGEQSFEGVALKDFLESLNVTQGKLIVAAINDYRIEMPVSDALSDGPIIAYLNNGQEMSVRDKGPLWIVYPYDSDPKYQSEVVFSRSIWQLNRIEIAP